MPPSPGEVKRRPRYVTEARDYNPPVAKRSSRRAPNAPVQIDTLPPASARRGWFSPVLILIAVVFAVKLVVLLQLWTHPLLQPKGELDSAYYLDLARKVAGGDLLAGDRVFFLSPFYVYFLAVPLALSGGSLLVSLLFQVVVGTLAVWLVGDTARLFAGERARWIAMGLAGLCGYLTFNEIQVLQSSVDPFLTALGLWLLAKAWTATRHTTRWHLAAGGVVGCHALNRPNVLAWAVAAVALSLVIAWLKTRPGASADSNETLPARPGGLVRAAWPPLAVAIGFVLALAPVAIRNYAVAGQFAPVSSHGGLNFFIGNNADADGMYKTVRGVTPNMSGQDRDMRKVASDAVGHDVSDTEASSWFYQRAFDWIRGNPGPAARLFVRKLAYAVNAADIPLNQSFAFYRSDESLALAAQFVGAWLLLPLGLAGIWFGRPQGTDARQRRLAWWAWTSFIPVYTLAMVVFFVTGRYRVPVLVALCVPAASALDAAIGWWQERRTRPLLVMGAVALALGIVTNWNLHIDEGLAGWRAEMVQYYVESGQYQAADALLARTEPIYPNPGLLLYRVANTYLSKGEPGRAVPLLERALTKAPDRLEIQLLLGEALVTANRPAEAVPHLRAALAGGYRRDVTAWGLARALADAGNNAEALDVLRQLPQPETLDPRSQARLGRLALDLGDAALAEQFLSRAVARAPQVATAQEGLGLALGMLGRRGEAVAALEAATSLEPANPVIRLNLAVAYAQAGRTGEARSLAMDVLSAHPNYDRARQFLESLDRR